MNRSTPGLPVHHQLPEFTQIHIHRVSDAIQRVSDAIQWIESQINQNYFSLNLYSYKQHTMTLLRNVMICPIYYITWHWRNLRNFIFNIVLSTLQFSSVAQSYQSLCDPMDWNMPGFPVHHKFPELTQTHVHSSVMSSNHLILCHPLLLPPSIFPSIRVLSNESVLPIKWPKYWRFSFNISPSNEYSGLIFL